MPRGKCWSCHSDSTIGVCLMHCGGCWVGKSLLVPCVCMGWSGDASLTPHNCRMNALMNGYIRSMWVMVMVMGTGMHETPPPLYLLVKSTAFPRMCKGHIS